MSRLEFQSRKAMLQCRARLAAKGIPTLTGHDDAASKDSDKRYRLSLLHEQQWPDALALSKNPAHEVSTTLSEDDLKASRLRIAKEEQGNLLSLAIQLSQIVSVGLLFALLLFWLLSFLNG